MKTAKLVDKNDNFIRTVTPADFMLLSKYERRNVRCNGICENGDECNALVLLRKNGDGYILYSREHKPTCSKHVVTIQPRYVDSASGEGIDVDSLLNSFATDATPSTPRDMPQDTITHGRKANKDNTGDYDRETFYSGETKTRKPALRTLLCSAYHAPIDTIWGNKVVANFLLCDHTLHRYSAPGSAEGMKAVIAHAARFFYKDETMTLHMYLRAEDTTMLIDMHVPDQVYFWELVEKYFQLSQTPNCGDRLGFCANLRYAGSDGNVDRYTCEAHGHIIKLSARDLNT